LWMLLICALEVLSGAADDLRLPIAGWIRSSQNV